MSDDVACRYTTWEQWRFMVYMVVIFAFLGRGCRIDSNVTHDLCLLLSDSVHAEILTEIKTECPVP